MLNHIVLMGRLVRDPEMRQTQSGVPVTNFTLAVARDYSSGEEKQTDFIDVVAWRQNAEFASKFLSKGRMVVVDGRLEQRKWKDKDGNNRYSYEVVANSIYFGESKRAESGAEDQAAPTLAYAKLEGEDDELPF